MVGSLLVLIYTLLQTLLPCLPPVPLSHKALTTEKYLGKWYFVGVASWHKEDIVGFQEIDSSVVELKLTEVNKLVMAGALRERDQCINTAWNYTLNPDLDPVMEEGVDHFGVALDGSWIKCPSCMMFAKAHLNDDAIFRIMLFARDENPPAEVVKRFKAKMECFVVIDEFMIAPQKKEFCQLEGTA